MSLAAGARLGPYEVVAPIGAGGMGEVYKATDTRLERTVAIKVLPEHLAESSERKQRFEREAKLISQLNHPHICTLYDVRLRQGYGGQVREAGDIDYMVMEYLEGETLAERLKKGAVPFDEAVRLGTQIAEGLDAAHAAGIVHRDLKPGNVILTKSGAKLLDFGLSRSFERLAFSDGSDAPTRGADITKERTILGTPQYMAPEQVEGKTVSARADIHALGAVLYEMVTGRKAFEGGSHASLVSAILISTPEPASEVVPTTPASLDYVISTCLEKDPAQRWHSAHDVAVALKGSGAAGGDGAEPTKQARSGWILAALAGALVAAFAAWSLSPAIAPNPDGTIRMTIKLPEGQRTHDSSFTSSIAISPDNQRIVFVAQPIQGTTSSLYSRELAALEARSLSGTANFFQPTFSPDGRALAVANVSGRQAILAMSMDSGVTEEVATFSGGLSGVSWGDDGYIWFGTGVNLWRVLATGGEPERMSTLAPGESGHRNPFVLPGGHGVLFSVGRDYVYFVAYLSPTTGQHRVLFEGVTGGYLDSGYVVYARGSELLAVPFDLDSLEATAEPRVVARDILLQTVNPYFAVGAGGTLAYASQRDAEQTVVWVDRTGVETLVSDEGDIHSLSLSPDGSRFAADYAGGNSLWVHDLERGTRTLVAANPGGVIPRWTPDGTNLVYASEGNLSMKSSDGSGGIRMLLDRARNQFPLSWTADGEVLAITDFGETGNRDIWLLDRDGKAMPYLATDANENGAAISPDGNWIAYQSDESGRDEIYVQPFLGSGRRVLVSANGGRAPLWARNGRELFYRQATALMSVSVDAAAGSPFGKPVLIFDGPYQADATGHPSYDVSPDGERFLMVRLDGVAPTELNVILNIEAELAQN